MLAFVACKNSLTRLAQPHSAGKTNSAETAETVLFPEKCDLDITISAMTAGIESPAQIMVMSRFSVFAVSAKASTAAATDEPKTAMPDKTAKRPAGKLRFSG